MELHTERLFLRPWQKEDAEVLFLLAKDPEVGPRCGWLPHQDLKESRMILTNVLMNDYTWAIIRNEDDTLIGNISLMPYKVSGIAENEKEAEIGYWLGHPFWGNGYMTEACARVMRYGFEDLSLSVIRCRHAQLNTASGRVQEKNGLRVYASSVSDMPGLYTGGIDLHRKITIEEWLEEQNHS